MPSAGIPERPPEPASPGWPSFADHLARYVFAAQFVRDKSVLDAGCGGGYGAQILRASGAHSVLGVDLDVASIERARTDYPGIEFIVDDCQVLDKLADRRFDVIVSFENIEHLPQPERFLAAAAGLLLPDGIVIISTPDRAGTDPFIDGRPRNPYHFHEWYREEFAAMLGKFFQHCELRVQVASYALERHRAGARALVRYCKRNPVSRLVGIASFAFLRRSYWQPILDLATPSPADYPIVGRETAKLFGSPWCHVAICAEPV